MKYVIHRKTDRLLSPNIRLLDSVLVSLLGETAWLSPGNLEIKFRVQVVLPWPIFVSIINISLANKLALLTARESYLRRILDIGQSLLTLTFTV